jgi:hypothetical protein
MRPQASEGEAQHGPFGRMDHEHVLALVEADHGAHGHAINGFAANAAFVDDESQFSTPNTIERATLAKKADRTLNKSELGLAGCGTQRPVSTFAAGQGVAHNSAIQTMAHQRPDCVAGVRGLKLRNPCASYVFEIS